MPLQLTTPPSSSSLHLFFSTLHNKRPSNLPFTSLQHKPLLSSSPHYLRAIESFNTTTHNCIHYPDGKIKCSDELKIVHGEKLLSELSTWGIGGPCNHFVQVFNHAQLISAIRFCRENSIGFVIVGKGSNCLFDDKGFDGCVILNRIEFVEMTKLGGYRVGSGYSFNRFGVQSCIDGFSGLEFAGGIPGTVGGAVYMNAGADGQETADAIASVELSTIDGECRILNRNDLAFGYRWSSFQEMEDLAAIISVTFHLKASSSSRQRQQDYMARRRLLQPVGERSAGSVFRNPLGMGITAGELIEKAGMKGFTVGGAKVSDKHANFFINLSSSTSRDMRELIYVVKEKVYRKFGIQLREEIRYISPLSSFNMIKGSVPREAIFQSMFGCGVTPEQAPQQWK